MQKYRADTSEQQPDGAICWYAQWMGGPSLSRINNCRIDLAGEMRRAVYITDEPDTFFSQPAVTKIANKRVKGFVSQDDNGNLVFHPTYY